MRNFWQIAKGNENVELEDIFIKLNVALIGTGKHGDFFDNRNTYKDSANTNEYRIINDFCETVKLGDIFVLRKKVGQDLWHILAIGKVTSPYRYESIFSFVDKDKWDVQHCRRVEWFPIDEKDRNDITGGGMSIRFQIMNDDNPLRKEAERLINNIDGLNDFLS